MICQFLSNNFRLLYHFLSEPSKNLSILFRNQFESNQLTIPWIHDRNLFMINLVKLTFEPPHLLLIAMHKYNIWRQHLLNIVSRMHKISMSRETDCFYWHLTPKSLFPYGDEFAWVHNLLGQGSLDTISGKDDSVVFVWSPSKEQVSAKAALEHTRACHHY